MTNRYFEKNTVQIWERSLDLDADNLTKYYALLSSDEKQRADRFKFAKHRQYFIAARAIIKSILSNLLNLKPVDIIFEYNDKGKPSLAKHHQTDITFNLSHCTNQALFAIGREYALGIDIEVIKETYERDLAKRYFSEQEYTALLQTPKDKQSPAFYRLWSRKEALLKADGSGLSGGFRRISLSLEPCQELYSLNEHTWHIIPLEAPKGYQASLACHPTIQRLQYMAGDPLHERLAIKSEIAIK